MDWVSRFFRQLHHYAELDHRPALVTPSGSWRYGELLAEMQVWSQRIVSVVPGDIHVGQILSMTDNTLDGLLLDLACLQTHQTDFQASKCCLTALPAFFSRSQIDHVVTTWQPDAVHLPEHPLHAIPKTFQDTSKRLSDDALPAKLTFTSGSTGQPKGIALSANHLLQVAYNVSQAVAPLSISRHMVTLPISILLENIAGIYASLWQGATCILLPCSMLGWQGSSDIKVDELQRCVLQHRAESMILMPAMLRRWTAFRQALPSPPRLPTQLIAVGGAPLGIRSLSEARDVDLPVYEGYGLSEGGSVQTLNLPGQDRPGSVGKPLAHSLIHVNDDGEILIRSNAHDHGQMIALNVDSDSDGWYATGDLGQMDEDGYLYITGRKKNLIITAFGRNVSPEWLEAELLEISDRDDDIWVVSSRQNPDGDTDMIAVLWPGSGNDVIDVSRPGLMISQLNSRLPDYARIQGFCLPTPAFHVATGFATSNGRPKREYIQLYLQQNPHLIHGVQA